MPIFEYLCQDCDQIFESVEVWESHKATKCKHCESPNIQRIIGVHQVRTDPNTVKHNLPDPCPPLEELRGKQKPGHEGGYADKPYADTNLGNYNRRKDKQGNIIWEEKRRKYFHSK